MTGRVESLQIAVDETRALRQQVQDLECDVEKWQAIASQINTDWIPANDTLRQQMKDLKAGLQAIADHHDFERKTSLDDNDYDNARYHEERRNLALALMTPNARLTGAEPAGGASELKR